MEGTSIKIWLLAVFAGAILISCGTKQNKASTDEANQSLTEAVSGTWQGTIPCADCPGIEYELNLKPDHTYTEQSVYLEENVDPFIEKGRWQISEDSIITLNREQGLKYLKFTGEALKMLDAQKQPVTSELAEFYILERKTSSY
jgi:uncharacterized lipoprotein NlpE involved in copper resistance